MSDKHLHASEEEQLLRDIQALLADSQHSDNPLYPFLSQLFSLNERQRERLYRLVRISDGYHGISRDRNLTLVQQYDWQLRRLEKLARISDRYQNSLREMTEALRDASLQDPLTELGNRRFLMNQLKEETKRANCKGTSYVLGVLDVDRFKEVNDRYGHEAGDKVLREIAFAIRDALREQDLCGRWGGEEFLIILPETSIESAVPVFGRVSQGIKQIQVDFLEKLVSASIGLTSYQPGESYSSTLNRADTALLQAKSAGRDQIKTL
ncbi:GGDEF domain-containing protein [Orrella marina]|uniref:diguanylate cyclase n=2 Tax=Orrella marina TaxID=2163011 RepID=A0A2R4XFX9_9BURK|nr:GGDEF domain-containing protein [Orrella marina]